MPVRTIAIAFAPPHADLIIRFTNTGVALEHEAKADGYWAWDNVDARLGASVIEIHADGYKPYSQPFTWHHLPDDAGLPQPLNHQCNIGTDIPALEPDVPPPPPLPDPEVRDGHFYDRQTGKRIVIPATDQFWGYAFYREGRDLSPLVRESHELGAYEWRVFLQAGWLSPSILPLDHFVEFVDWANGQGIGIKVDVLADCQQLGQDGNAQANRLREVYDRAAGRRYLRISKGNEWSKNGFRPTDLPNPGPGILWGQGSGQGDEAPVRPEGSFSLFHPRRDMPKMMDDSVASSTWLRSNGYSAAFDMDEGIGFCARNEPGRRSNDPSLADRLATHYSKEWDAVCFHNEAGMSSVLMDEPTRRCAEAWFAALRRNAPA